MGRGSEGGPELAESTCAPHPQSTAVQPVTPTSGAHPPPQSVQQAWPEMGAEHGGHGGVRERERPPSATSCTSEDDVCWICLDTCRGDEQLLKMPCKCPRYAHQTCIARWQLQSAGTRKETHCEFCDSPLPQWREVFHPDSGGKVPVTAIMNVTLSGVTRGFAVAPGPGGYQRFTAEIQEVFNLPPDSELNITFTCDEPCEANTQLVLRGEGAFDAAVICASLSAARRNSRTDRGGCHDRRGVILSGKWIPKLGSLTKKLRVAIADLSCRTLSTSDHQPVLNQPRVRPPTSVIHS